MKNLTQSIILAAAALISGGLFAAVIMLCGPLYSFLILLLFLTSLLCLMCPLLAFYFFFIWNVCYGVFTNLTFLGRISAVDYVDEYFTTIIFISLLIRPQKVKANPGIFNLLWPIGAFCLFSLFSTVINKGSYLALVNFISTYIKLFIIIIGAVGLLDNEKLRRLIVFMLMTQVAQFIAAAVQFMTYGKAGLLVGPDVEMWQDAASGLLPNAKSLGHLSMMFVIISGSVLLFRFSRRYLLLFLASLAAFMLSFTRQGYIFIVFSLVAVLLIRTRIKIAAKAMLIAVLAVVVFVAFKYNFEVAQRYSEYLNDPYKLKSSGKMQSYRLVKDIFMQDVRNAVVGTAPGSFSSGSAAKFSGTYYNRYIGFRMGEIKSTLDYWWSSIMSLVSETGIIGFLLFWSCFVPLAMRAVRLYEAPQADWFEKAAAVSQNLMMLFILYISLLSNALEWINVTYPMAIVAAYVWKAYDHHASKAVSL